MKQYRALVSLNHMVNKPQFEMYFNYSTKFICFDLCTYVHKYILSINDVQKVYEWLGHHK